MKKFILFFILCPILTYGQYSLNLPGGIRTLNGKPADAKYYNLSGTVYASTAEVLSQIPSGIRGIGLTVNVNGIEYCFCSGITDGDLAVKFSSLTLTNGSGTTANSTSINLGGTATGNITVDMVGNSFSVSGTAASKTNSIGFSNAGGISLSSSGSSNSLINLYSQNSGGANHTQIDMSPTVGLLEGDKWELSGTALTIPSNNSLTSKTYVLGAKSYTGTQTFLTSTTSNASFIIPNGVAPTSPTNGMVWGESNHLWMRLNGVTYQLDQQSGGVSTSRNINTTSPLSGGGDLSADRTLSIANAAADGTTKGAASFTANDFDASSGNIGIDYTNGQAASTSTKGFLSSTDWNTFNDKLSAFGSQTQNTFYAAPNGSSGSPTFRAMVAADVPTLNQNTTGSAATLTTTRSIYGNNFNGSAALTQIIASTFGGTGNGFTKFSGPSGTEKTFSLPNVSGQILTDATTLTAPVNIDGAQDFTIGGNTPVSNFGIRVDETAGGTAYISTNGDNTVIGVNDDHVQLNNVSGALLSLEPGGQIIIVTTTNGINISDATNTGTIFKSILGNSATLNFPSTAAGAVSDLTITVSGAAINDTVFLGPPATGPTKGGFLAWVSATNTITVRYFNNDLTTAVDPASATFRVTVYHF